MLFNSFVFVFAFLPLALLGFALACRVGRRPAMLWLIIASLIFYGWWQPLFLPVLLVSILGNFIASRWIDRAAARPAVQTAILSAAIALNIGALVYYKYLAALVSGLYDVGLADHLLPAVALPLGISFFTFTQIGFLIDAQQGAARERGFVEYFLFVTFFPHLIAGPIVHHREIMPQFAQASTWRIDPANLSIGTSIFILGLMKKCLLADPTSAVVAPGFVDAAHLAAGQAWYVALSYSMQLYFDFSGYSDMAIGLARMFNVKFPLNFDSPYKATSIIEYWARWHMTLTRYITMYLYNPIALAIRRRSGATRASTLSGFGLLVGIPTMVTMALAGIWHGAGLQFLIFGLLHGMYLTIAHGWRAWRKLPHRAPEDGIAQRVGKIALTYACVLVGAVFFRALSVGNALDMLAGMIGLHGAGRLPSMSQLVWLLALFVIVWGMPNVQQIMASAVPALGKIRPSGWTWLAWQPSRTWAWGIGAGATLAILSFGGTAEFLYFQF